MSTGPENLEYKNETLSLRLQEAEQALNAIRNGEVDAIIVSAENRPKIYTLESPDLPYRQIVETMNAGRSRSTGQARCSTRTVSLPTC